MKIPHLESLQPLSQRLGHLTQDQLQSALDRFDLGALVDVQPVTSGLFGQNVFLTTKSSQWVFRGAPLMPWQFAMEQYFADQIRRNTNAPVPWPYYVEMSKDLFGWEYALMPRLPGTSPNELRNQLELRDFCEIAHVTGQGLAELQRLKVPTWGEYDPAKEKALPSDLSFSDGVAQTLDDWLSKTLEIPDALDKADLALVAEIHKDAGRSLAGPFEPTIVHHDYKEGNILVRAEQGGWQLSGIFDLMTCTYGDGEQDLPRMTGELASIDHSVAQAFISAYRKRTPLRQGYEERFRFYTLIDRMIIWEHARRNQIWFPPELRFRDYLDRGLQLVSLL